MYLLDTNVISELRKRRPRGAVAAWFEQARAEDILIPAVVIAEQQDGVEVTVRQDPNKSRDLNRWIDQIMTAFAGVPMTAEMFRKWSKMMVGKSANVAADARIAATARTLRIVVVARNARDCRPFGVDGLNPFNDPATQDVS